MKHRRVVIVLAALLVTAGCGVPEPTTQTSMLRGPTPSPGLSIPPLLRVSGAATSGVPSTPAAGSTGQPAQQEPVPGSTDQPDPTDDTAAVPTDQGLAGPDLSQIAASAGCTDYAELDPPDPGSSVSGACTVDDQQVLLYSFTSQTMAAAFADSLSSSGVTADELVQGTGYLFWADAGPIAKIKAALGAG